MKGIRKHVMIIGQPGSGKSTLARKMGSILELPVGHIDHIHWQSGWIERSGPEKDRLCADIHAGDTWIFEGGRSSTWRERLERADTVVWLDFSLRIRVWRILWRTLRFHGKSRPDLPAGCPKRFDWEFIRWIWNTRYSSHMRMTRFFAAIPDYRDKYRLRSTKQVDEYIASLY